MSENMHDVVGVDFGTKEVRLIAENKTLKNAEAIEEMAVVNMGCDGEFFAVVSAGSFCNGDIWGEA